MRIVVDVGCARYGNDYSVQRLLEAFEPDLLYGFDPNLDGDLGSEVDGFDVRFFRTAAWTRTGTVHYEQAGLRSTVSDSKRRPQVICFDLADFINALPEEAEVVLKIDAEGAEYVLLEHLIDQSVDERLKLAWIEWHPRADLTHQLRREAIESRIACEIQEWTF